MKEVDIGELNNPEDVKKYPKDTLFVLRDDKIFTPPDFLREKEKATSQK